MGQVLQTGSALTLVKHGQVVVDVAECDVDRGGARQPPQLAAHVLGLYDHRVVFPGLPVHVGQGDADDPCGERGRHGRW